MFKKLKDKLAEEVKSSPQRIQQFAQAAQAAVTSASSSISDITNNDLFSIGDSDSHQSRPTRLQSSDQQNTFQEVALFQPSSSQSTLEDFGSSHEIMDNQRQRKLSNSSFASDVSFRLPSYESPSMYHLQSDMEISASEAEERVISGGQVSLERVTKDQLYAAYRRTQERYTKYRTQYANLAHHYKLLERENAKARSVLVETQDKALRRISELREQCTLEQSAKAHLEKALRVDIEEKNMKIEALNTQIALLQNNTDMCRNDNKDSNANTSSNENEQEAQLINLAPDNEVKQCEQVASAELTALNNKIEKMEQLLNKYKESLKINKEKNSQMTAELQKLGNELENKIKENDILKTTSTQLVEAKNRIQELNLINEELQNKINTYDFCKTKEASTLELDLQRAKEEIVELNNKIEIFTKREEEYAISLAENKLSIHKELESKESEIKKLKEHLSAAKKELQSINIIVSDYKTNLASLEEEKTKLTNEVQELSSAKSKIKEQESQIQSLIQKVQSLEQFKAKCDEECKCLQLQMKQETAEKLAMIDRNGYLENRNAQLTEENTKKSSHINKLENEMQILKSEKENDREISEKLQIQEELEIWKAKYSNLESEIQEERDELVKLQSEIEKLLRNHELIQNQNSDLNAAVTKLKSENSALQQNSILVKPALIKLSNEVRTLRNIIQQVSSYSKSYETEINNNVMPELLENFNTVVKFSKSYENINLKYKDLTKEYNILQDRFQEVLKSQEATSNNLLQLETDNKKLTAQIHEYEDLQRNYGDSQNELKETVSKQQAISAELLNVKEENAILRSKIQNYEVLQKDYELSQREIQELKNQVGAHENKYYIALKEIDDLKSSIQEFEALQNKYHNSQTELAEVTRNYNALIKELQFTQKEFENLCVKIQGYEKLQKDYENKEEALKHITNEREKIKKEFEYTQKQNLELESQLQNFISEIENFKELQLRGANKLKESEALANKVRQDCAEKEMKIANLETKLDSIIQENVSLKNQSENIKKNAVSLEAEIEEVRRVHSIMETEKDCLNLIIEQLEKNQQSVEMVNKETQAENLSKVQNENHVPENELNEKEQRIQSLLRDIDSLNSKNAECEKEITSLKVINTQLSDKTLNQKVEEITREQISEEYSALNNECEILRQENKRLLSDIEGLQIYLTKISKENSDLNDRLRELIASSENLSDKNENPSDLQKEIDMGKQTIDDLLRENSLLIEENLELKDQIQSQNYVKPETVSSHSNNDVELASIKEKYNELLNAKKSLEDRVHDLEQINRSVNGNVQQVQDGNQKLRLANEKLERRLDEALVSLRHLHSLQENTELEYLRNILYEYLTGSGTHSITLAKVLAAVVKFDDKQTQTVLQKEKERQGVLHQIGLM